MIKALLDANVLYPAPIRDLLLSLAEEDLFKPFWSRQIHEEWKRNLLVNRPELDPLRINRTISLMDTAFPDANVEGFEHRIPELSLSDTDDRHVLAAALEASAHFLVTANLKDFDSKAGQKFNVEIIHPDKFVALLIFENKEATAQSFERMVARLKNPPQSKQETLKTLQNCGLIESAKLLYEM